MLDLMVLLMLIEMVLERVWLLQKMRIEVLELCERVMSVHAVDGMGERQGSVHAHARRVKVAGLRVIEGAVATWSWGVVARRLVRKSRESKGIGIHE